MNFYVGDKLIDHCEKQCDKSERNNYVERMGNKGGSADQASYELGKGCQQCSCNQRDQENETHRQNHCKRNKPLADENPYALSRFRLDSPYLIQRSLKLPDYTSSTN